MTKAGNSRNNAWAKACQDRHAGSVSTIWRRRFARAQCGVLFDQLEPLMHVAERGDETAPEDAALHDDVVGAEIERGRFDVACGRCRQHHDREIRRLRLDPVHELQRMRLARLLVDDDGVALSPPSAEPGSRTGQTPSGDTVAFSGSYGT
jgi:hypothetical protein